MVEISQEIDSLGFDEYPEPVENMLAQYDWADFLNKLRVGVVLTFSILESRKQHYIAYNLHKLSDGRQVFLIRPAWLNKGYDFKVCVEDWDESANPAPSHQEIYSDLYWKRKYDESQSFQAICEAVFEIHDGEDPDEVLETYSPKMDFTVGRRPEGLLKPLPWIFIEQDIRYWNYEGRDMTIDLVERLCEGDPLSELTLDLQTLEEIHESPLAISN